MYLPVFSDAIEITMKQMGKCKHYNVPTKHEKMQGVHNLEGYG